MVRSIPPTPPWCWWEKKPSEEQSKTRAVKIRTYHEQSATTRSLRHFLFSTEVIFCSSSYLSGEALCWACELLYIHALTPTHTWDLPSYAAAAAQRWWPLRSWGSFLRRSVTTVDDAPESKLISASAVHCANLLISSLPTKKHPRSPRWSNSAADTCNSFRKSSTLSLVQSTQRKAKPKTSQS